MRERWVIRLPTHLGDWVLCEPLLRALDAEPALEVRLLGPARYFDLIEARFPRLQQIALKKELAERREHYAGATRALFLNGSARGPALACLAGVRERHGLGSRGRSWLLTHPTQSMGPRPFTSVCVELLAGMGVTVREREPRLLPSPRTQALASERLQQLGVQAPFVMINAGAREGSAKALEPSELLRYLAHERRPVLLVAGPGEAAHARRCAELLPSAALAEEVGLQELIGLAQAAAVVLSADGGARHVARASGARSVVLFGPTDPRHTADGAFAEQGFAARIECGPCHREICPRAGADQRRCWRSLDAERIARALQAAPR
jgi:heptosyltransferase II